MSDESMHLLPGGDMLSPAYLEMTTILPDDRALDLQEPLAAALEGLALATTLMLPDSQNATHRFQAHFEEHTAQSDILMRLAVFEAVNSVVLTPVFTLLPPTNWLEVAYQAHPPLKIGRFVIYGSHDRPALSAREIGLEIEAATAFGTGQHGTTAGCLLALAAIEQSGTPPQNIADIGTGSGILALAAHRLWHCPVVATDIDAEAIRVTRLHMQTNNVPEGRKGITLVVADGTQDDTINQLGPYDLVIANILAGPLREMAPDLVGLASASGGQILLSGLLTTQFSEVLAAYQALGCKLVAHTTRDEWSIVLLTR